MAEPIENVGRILLWNMREQFWCPAILQNGVPSLNVEEMALDNRESHQLLAAKGGMKFGGLKHFWRAIKHAIPR